MSKFAVITGVSKGLGEQLASLFLESGVNVLGISRNTNNKLSQLAKGYNRVFKHYSCDISDISALEDTFNNLKEELFNYDITSLYLINNAAVVEPIDQAINIESDALLRHFQINSIAPMVLTNLFLKQAGNVGVPMLAVAVTSGAGERPIYGWSAYGSSKASVNMYTRVVALEQETLKSGSKVIAFNPGVMDTGMQETIRSTTEEAFSDVERFKQLKENNALNTPAIVAGVLIDILNDEDVVNGKIYDVKNYV
ncbi:(S)-benzoin forming benzil reductase [Oceanobacillus bengalensis]|uniref:(S)-benzoin forming benzil reductase n=1 Tax=Oceanobacillus bengalensis TaxID=1435466 RepID=A0A494Z849_9BACI|nr:(S)-benzoin forming benzil reductase [Oceanobacillus bengalensis]RKQ18774.1 (S)-benzoin forming benzil reductase [Oceanobacillus bengalensis]